MYTTPSEESKASIKSIQISKMKKENIIWSKRMKTCVGLMFIMPMNVHPFVFLRNAANLSQMQQYPQCDKNIYITPFMTMNVAAFPPMEYKDDRSESRGGRLSNLEKRLRNITISGMKKKKPGPQKRRPGQGDIPHNVHRVETLAEYKTVVADEKKKIVIVRFFAPWCKACQAMEPYFYRMARKYPQISFVEVPITAKNADLHQGLNIPRVPFGHIYHPEAGLVEERRVLKKLFPEFETMAQWYIDGFCELPEDWKDCSSPFQSKHDEKPKHDEDTSWAF